MIQRRMFPSQSSYIVWPDPAWVASTETEMMDDFEQRNRELEQPVLIIGAVFALGLLATIGHLLGLA